MAERLSDIAARIGSVNQLSAVIGAMRGIAAVQLREAESRLEGIRTYAQTIGAAIGEALALAASDAPVRPARRNGGCLVIALCGEHGFTGRHDDPILDRALALAGSEAGSTAKLLLVGDRGLAKAAERGVEPWRTLAMATHAEEVASVAGRVTELLYDLLLDGESTAAMIVHAVPGHGGATQVVDKQLLPFDFERFATVGIAHAALVNLAPARLLESLSEEYIFAQLCEALMLAYAAENGARMRAMINARSNVDSRITELTATLCRLRQESITSEVIELAGGALAQR